MAWADVPRRHATSSASSSSSSSGSSSLDGSAGRPLSETSSLLRGLRTGAEVYLIGTAHVSRASADQVRATIRAVRPTTVFVELCPERAERLARGGAAGESAADFLKARTEGKRRDPAALIARFPPGAPPACS